MTSKTFLEGNQSITPVEPDFVITDEETSLQSAGFPFTVLHTPGHTAGSLSLIDKSVSRAYVGDTMFNIPVLSGRKYHPPFADIPAAIAGSWKKLLNTGVSYFYPAHGKRISRYRLESELKKLESTES